MPRPLSPFPRSHHEHIVCRRRQHRFCAGLPRVCQWQSQAGPAAAPHCSCSARGSAAKSRCRRERCRMQPPGSCSMPPCTSVLSPGTDSRRSTRSHPLSRGKLAVPSLVANNRRMLRQLSLRRSLIGAHAIRLFCGPSHSAQSCCHPSDEPPIDKEPSLLGPETEDVDLAGRAAHLAVACISQVAMTGGAGLANPAPRRLH